MAKRTKKQKTKDLIEAGKNTRFPGSNQNKKGRPRKSFSQINLTLKKAGVEVLTKDALIEAYQLIFNCTQDELNVIQQDKETPVAFKLIIAELGDKKTRAKALADYRDYCFGKALQQTEDLTKRGTSDEEINKRLRELKLID